MRNGKWRPIPVLESPFAKTPIMRLSAQPGDQDLPFSPAFDNEIFVKRDDLIPFSFGGNKARKAACFYRDIMEKQPDIVMTYGTSSSNHCRIIANMACAMGMPCHIISPEEESEDTRHFNRMLVERFGASVETVPVTMVHDTIERRKEAFAAEGKIPYFIQGGGHGNVGTLAHVLAWQEILEQEEETGIHFDRLFLASGTGATQGGLVAGKLLYGGDTKIKGISIARACPRGRDAVRESILDFLSQSKIGKQDLYTEECLDFDDHYILGGYGRYDDAVEETVRYMMDREGIPLDTTYTGKAFTGMLRFLSENGIRGERILFLHTGGTPLFFDNMTRRAK